jgi:hypothetical protein
MAQLSSPPPPGQVAAELLALAIKEGTKHLDTITWFVQWGSFIYTNLWWVVPTVTMTIWICFSLGRACRCIMCTPWLLVLLAVTIGFMLLIQISLFPGSVVVL